MHKYRHDTVVPFKQSRRSKKDQVAEMFDHIAFRYDLMNRFLSVGIDRHWRKMALKELMALHPGQVLDVATGTADMPILMMKHLRPNQIVGVDISAGMLELGRRKIERLHLSPFIDLKTADCADLPFASDTFDAISVAFGVRNFEFLEIALRDMLRVLKPGGKLVILEFSKPHRPVLKELYCVYLRYITPMLGNLFSNNREAYQYLHDSVRAFPEGEEFIRILVQSGYTRTYLIPLSGGICTVYCGHKSPLL